MLVVLVPSIIMLSLGVSFSIGCLVFSALYIPSVFLGCLVLTLKGSDVKTTFSLGQHNFFGSFQSNIMLP